jgi:hypothetical protein
VQPALFCIHKFATNKKQLNSIAIKSIATSVRALFVSNTAMKKATDEGGLLE